LDAVVCNTFYHNLTYAGESLYMRRVLGETHNFGVPLDNPDVYGLASLDTLPPNEHGMLNMMDIGGNVGVVTLAAFKKHGQKLRIVAVEPVPSTYFLFVWNLFLNGVPSLSQEQFTSNPTQAGVLALNRGITSTDDQIIGLCYQPPFTMNALICNCQAQTGVVSHEAGVNQCASVSSHSFPYLLNLFGQDAPIAFLKVDCEGCENDLLPALTQISQNPAWKLGRLAGELHLVSNAVEDMVCKFEAGKWFEHICNTGTPTAPIMSVPVDVPQRCSEGASRKPCTIP